MSSSKEILTHPAVEEAHREGGERGDNAPEVDLFECYTLWASGAWDDRNATDDLAEVMSHIERLLDLPKS